MISNLVQRMLRLQQPAVRCWTLVGTCRQLSAATGNIVRSPLPELTIQDSTPLAHYVISTFNKYHSKVALIEGVTGRTVTYGQLEDQVRAVASSLVRRGVRKGDVVTLFAVNSPEFVVAYLAVVALGAVISCVNPAYTTGELKHALQFGESTLIIADSTLLPIVNDTLQSMQTTMDIISIGEAKGFQTLQGMCGSDRSLFPESLDINNKVDVVALPFSSGTTGLPKAVQLTHHNIISNMEQSRDASLLAYEDSDIFMGLLPFYHIYGQTLVMLAGLKTGSTIVTMPKFQPQVFLENIQNYKVSLLHVAPPLVVFLAKHPLVEEYDMTSLQYAVSGAAPLGGNVIEQAITRMRSPNLVFGQVYGLTESSPITHASPRYSTLGSKPEALGVPVQNTDMKIIDVDSGDKLPAHQTGELCVRGPQVMPGYLKNREATDKTLIDGWLHTGDICYYDEDTFTFITDRLKELIKVKGLQVAPAELEAVLLHHPSVQDTAVIGVPDERAGELPRAYVVLKEDRKANIEELQAFVSDQVAPYKQLAGGIEFRSSIPKTTSGKILRRELKEEFKNATKS